MTEREYKELMQSLQNMDFYQKFNRLVCNKMLLEVRQRNLQNIADDWSNISEVPVKNIPRPGRM